MGVKVRQWKGARIGLDQGVSRPPRCHRTSPRCHRISQSHER